jgi:glycosyltransferase involved in cell wall biosynthesis
MPQPDFSLILPVYNSARYLKEALESLINQTWPHIEIICVDNGSRDSSMAILQQYAACDTRIKVYTEPKRGAAAARNCGIKAAAGRFIAFCDSDDFIDINYCAFAYRLFEKTGADIIFIGVAEFYDDNSSRHYTYSPTLHKFFANRRRQKTFCFNSRNAGLFISSPLYAVNKIYKREILSGNSPVLFKTQLKAAEDIDFWLNILTRDAAFSLIEKPLYFYRQNVPDSLTQTKLFNFAYTWQAFKNAGYYFKAKTADKIFLDKLLFLLYGRKLGFFIKIFGRASLRQRLKLLPYMGKLCYEGKKYAGRFNKETWADYTLIKKKIKKYAFIPLLFQNCRQ